VNKRDDLKVDALPHRKPVQLTKHWCDVVTSSRAGDQPGGSERDTHAYIFPIDKEQHRSCEVSQVPSTLAS